MSLLLAPRISVVKSTVPLLSHQEFRKLRLTWSGRCAAWWWQFGVVRNTVVAVTDWKTFGRASGQWSVAEQPCHNTWALLVRVNKRKKKKKSSKAWHRHLDQETVEQDPGSGGGVQMPASPACPARARPSEVFVPVLPEQKRACPRRTQLQPEVELRRPSTLDPPTPMPPTVERTT